MQTRFVQVGGPLQDGIPVQQGGPTTILLLRVEHWEGLLILLGAASGELMSEKNRGEGA